MNTTVSTCSARIADCFKGRDGAGRLIQRLDALNLAGLGLTAKDVEDRFVVEDRGLGEIGFEDLVHLRYLDLTSNQLERLPRGVGTFGHLQWLGLNFNRIESLSHGAGDWPELRCLYLRENSLRSLPERSSGWGQLVELDLFGNRALVSLPPALVRMLLERFSKSELGHVVLGETELWTRMKQAGLEGDPADGVTLAMLEWIAQQDHESEPAVDKSFDVVRRDAPDAVAWLYERVREDGGLKLVQVLASLGLEDREWLPVLENPETLLRRSWNADELRALEQAWTKVPAEGRYRQWEAWYAAGLSHCLELELGPRSAETGEGEGSKPSGNGRRGLQDPRGLPGDNHVRGRSQWH